MIDEIIATGRSREGIAVTAPHRQTPYSYHEFATSVWKTGNLFAHYGAHPDAAVAVATHPPGGAHGSDNGPTATGDEEGHHSSPLETVQPLLAILGGMVVGSGITVPETRTVEAAVFAVPTALRREYEFAPGCSVLVYGQPPADPTVQQFEVARSSQNPVKPPETPDPDGTALAIGTHRLTFDEVASATSTLIERFEMDERTTIILAAPILDPRTILAGVIAPLAAGSMIVLFDTSAGVLPEELDSVETPPSANRSTSTYLVTTDNRVPENADPRYIGLSAVPYG